MTFSFKRKSKKNNKRNITRRKRSKLKATRRKYSNKKRVTRKIGGNGKRDRTKLDEDEDIEEVNENTKVEYDQATPITRLKIEKLRDFGYEINFDIHDNKWYIYKYPEILLPNRKLPYLLRKLSSNDRKNLFDLLMSNPDQAIPDNLVDVFNQIIHKNISGCDLETDQLVGQAISDESITADQIAPYRGKIGTIVSPDGRSIDITDGMKPVANVRVVVPMELPQAIITQSGLITTPLRQGLYKLVKKQDGSIMIAPSNCVNFSMIKYYGLKYLDPPGTPINGGNQNLFFVNMDKILPKIRLLASFGYGDIYNQWISFLQYLGNRYITANITQQNIIDASNELFNNTVEIIFQSSPEEIIDWIKDQRLDLSKYIDYPGWEHTCLTISEISHPCLNQGILDVEAAGEFCVICDANGLNCCIVKVTTYSGHYQPPEILLPMIKEGFDHKGYTNLIYSPQYQCLAISKLEARKRQNECPPYDPTALPREQGAAPFVMRSHSQQEDI